MILGYSRKKFAAFATCMDELTLQRMHVAAFRFFTGVPYQVLYDNLRTVTIGRDAHFKPILQEDFADFSALQTLSPATVKASLKSTSSANRDAEFHVTLENTGKNLAFLVHMRLAKGKDSADILPIFWEDNYISLLPGERREVQVRLRKSDLGSVQPDLIVDGFNLPAQTVHIAH